MDGRGSDTRGEVELKDSGEVPLTEMAGGNGRSFAIGVFWTEKSKNLLKESFGAKASTKSENTKESIKLADCIDAFVTEETLPKSEAWYCRPCKGHKEAQKKFDIWSAPDTLIIHLKRFNYDRLWRDKIDTYVDFPVEGFDLSKWIVSDEEKKDSLYDLYAVSNHFGGLGGGHYTAYAKNLLDHHWYNLDDSRDRKSGSAGMPRPISYAVFCLKKKKK
eukprot:TRINITY_DN1501_c0_g1_i14.p1 TRINITY_DN1501_c0_g1~~TRINITY_DN1501_c0_g1_i14.p1  ORF type:complete len:218 (-),score=48.92 TRINITY_DN1501_c0_g1_i14:10-663(-)